MSSHLSEEARDRQRIVQSRQQLHFIVALLDHPGPMPEETRISLEAWAAMLRQYLNIRAGYAFVVKVPEPGELERLGLPLLEEGASGDES